MWFVDMKGMSEAEQVMVVSLQGLVNKQGPHILLDMEYMTQVIKQELEAEGVKLEGESSAWALLERFKDHVQGLAVYKLGQDCLNVAASMCGPKALVAVDESILDKALSLGFEVKFDARGMNEAQCWEQYKDLFVRGMAVEQTIEKPVHLRDWGVYNNAFIFHGKDRELRKAVAREVGPQGLVYGWGGDEYEWIDDLAVSGCAGVPADWSVNLSLLCQLKAELPARPHSYPAPAKEGERIVCIVMSDGDNIQWMAGGFNFQNGFWASPHRGKHNLAWEMAPSFVDVGPRVLRHFYKTASGGQFKDDFICGPSGAAYTFPTRRPDRKQFAEQTADFMKRTDMQIVSVIDTEGDMSQMADLLDRDEIMGVFFKDYIPYHKFSGKIFWHNGKPSISYTYVLWEPDYESSLEGVAEAIAKQPASPTTDPASYALINVHAWSWDKMGGPMEAVNKFISMLPPNTRVVTGEEFIILLRNNFGTPVPEPGK